MNSIIGPHDGKGNSKLHYTNEAIIDDGCQMILWVQFNNKISQTIPSR